MKKKIIIIEDEAIIAIEIQAILEQLDYEVVAHEVNGDKALDTFAHVSADLIILDINIKGTRNGIDLAKVIRSKYNTPFVFLTSYSDQVTLDLVKETMPYGYIVKPFTEHDLRSCISLALHKYESEQQKQNSSKTYIEKKLEVGLTDREYDILIAFKDGKTYREVGESLFISINTVKSYQKRLFALLDVSNKVELINKLTT